MSLRSKPRAVVVLPGTGSSAEFVHSAFARSVTHLRVPLVTVEPNPQAVIESYVTAMDAAVDRYGPIVVGGVSLGAAAALNWASTAGDAAVAVLAALPPWTGDPDDAPAAASAAFTAEKLRDDGLAAVSAAMRAGSPAWLADTLTKSWAQQWPDLPAALEEAARYRAPTEDQLRSCRVPVGICATTDDPVHQVAVARLWRSLLPHAGLHETTLDRIGADHAELGDGTVAALALAGYPLY